MQTTLLKTENMIQKSWTNPDIMVSICCITYNQEEYITDTLDGFIQQETAFPFEIIIHDDASTDKTADIIRIYHSKYPTIIKPIYQTDNQYSKGVEIYAEFVFPSAKGDFVALCEGDDYWIDPHKLQKQVDALLDHPSCDLCFHPAYGLSRNGEKKILCDYGAKARIISSPEVILGGGGFMPTASILYRKSVNEHIQSFYEVCPTPPVSDIIYQFLGSMRGGALYLSDIMSIYRTDFPGSWSAEINSNSDARKKFITPLINLYELLDQFSKGLFHKEIRSIHNGIVVGALSNINFDRTSRQTFKKEYSHYLKPLDKTRIKLTLIKKTIRHSIKKILTCFGLYNAYEK